MLLVYFSFACQKQDTAAKAGKNKDIAPKANSEDCSNWIMTQPDRMTGKTMTSVKEPITVSSDGRTGISLILMNSHHNSTILSILANEDDASSCIDKRYEINILFTDESRLELLNQGEFNCSGQATVYFGDVFGNDAAFDELKNKKIAAMRVRTRSSLVERDFTDEQATTFLNQIKCLSKSRK